MKKYILIGLVGLGIGFGFYSKVYVPKHTFATLSPTVSNMQVRVNGVGEVGAKNIYKVASLYSGRVQNFQLNEGDFVKKGSTIAVIDSVDLNDKIKETQATLLKLKSDKKSLRLDKQSAQVTYNYQKDLLKKNKKLYAKKAISELEYKKFQTDAKVANLKVQTLQAKINSLTHQQTQLQATLSGLEQRLERFTIVAPTDGYITKKYIANGDVVMPSSPIVEVVNPKDVWVATYIDTRISGDVKIGDIATMKLRSSARKFGGKVVAINPINNNVTYEREIDIAFDNLPIPFYLKEQAIVNIDIETLKDIVKVPSKALTTYKEQEGVWIVKDSILHFKPITILAYGDKYVATKDIAQNDVLVVPDPKKKPLSEGMKINEK